MIHEKCDSTRPFRRVWTSDIRAHAILGDLSCTSNASGLQNDVSLANLYRSEPKGTYNVEIVPTVMVSER